MAIKIGGTSIIDDNKNIANVGIITIGTGGETGKIQVGTGTTIFGSGNVSIAGTLYALDVVTPIKVIAFSPADGSTGVTTTSAASVEITFDREVAVGATGFIKFTGGTGQTIETIGVGDTSRFTFTNSNKTLKITPTVPFAKGTPGVANTIRTLIDKTFLSEPTFLGINTTGSNVTYSFTMDTVILGESYEGGYFICYGGGVQWIVAPSSTQVQRTWNARADSVTTANASAPCGDWFVPSCGQLKNPGYVCRSYWDSISCPPNSIYWSNAANSPTQAISLDFADGTTYNVFAKSGIFGVRAFRCITY